MFTRQSTILLSYDYVLVFKSTVNLRYSYTLFLRVEGLGVQPPPNNPLADSQVEDLQNREYTRNPILRLPLLGCNMLNYQITHKLILYANAPKQSKYVNAMFVILDAYTWVILM